MSDIFSYSKINTFSNCRELYHINYIQEILKKSIKMGGTTLRDFSYSQGEEKIGYFKQELFTYGRTGAQCKLCRSPIRQIVLSGRSSFYCVSCQY